MSRFYEFIQKIRGEEALLDGFHPTTLPDDSTELRDLLALTASEWKPTGTPGFQQTALSLADIPTENIEILPEARLITHTDSRSVAADRYRFLRLRLNSLGKAGSLKTILVTSPIPRDGKTTVALNLASALLDKRAQSVLVIDADLHHSAASCSLGLQGRPGLTECLSKKVHPLSTVRRLEPLGWHFMPAGVPGVQPTQLLQDDGLPGLLKSLGSYFDWVILDAPPVLPLTDATLLSQHADGILLVARADKTPRAALEDTVSTLGKRRIIGLVLNGVLEATKRYGDYGHYYGKRSSRPEQPPAVPDDIEDR